MWEKVLYLTVLLPGRSSTPETGSARPQLMPGGICHSPARDYTLVDIPGTYSLSSRSAEEEVARDFICFGAHQAVVIVCDATCLERNLNLVLQILEATDRTLVCVKSFR